MSLTTNTHTTRAEIKGLTLFDTLYNDLILRHTLPYLPVSGILNLAATCKDIRYLLHNTPGVFRHLDLTRVKTAHVEDVKQERNLAVWHNVELEDYLTEDDFYAGPLRGIFSTLRNRNILQNVQSLILDGLSVTAELCHDIINNPDYNVRMLSIRGAKNLNQAKLRAALAYACRPTRPSNPRLKALYIFSETTDDDAYWHNKGRVMESTSGMDDWAQCLLACQGIISFDAVLCQGPRHVNSPSFGNPPVKTAANPAVATFAVGGCASCGKAPEGIMTAETHSSALPLLSPPPILSSSVQAATTPRPNHTSFVPRCAGCLNDRFCVTCNKWWCEACYQPFNNSCDMSKRQVSRSCWECGMNCNECIEATQKKCKKCCGGYCLVHNEGSSEQFCDWCFSSGRGLRRVSQS
ncbi:hypothetical protein LB507_008649 [Fusarium sp. FIESC RH6]|nr:hypothetical protein LB507_008649 [Fusarium sp. FIESC RH6]